MKKRKDLIITIFLIIIAILAIVAIGFTSYGIYKKVTRNIPNPLATIEVENYGTIKVELYPDKAPNTVTNFIALANRGYYNGKTFHRTIPEFMIQGGSKNGDGTGDPTLDDLKGNGDNSEYTIKGEFAINEFDNGIKLKKGVIAMARADYSSYASLAQSYSEYDAVLKRGYDSASAQFFIMNSDNSDIDGLYAAFGEVKEGLEIVNTIANVEVVTRESNADGADRPVNPPVIKSITVETYGVDYGEPETLEPFDVAQWYSEHAGSTLTAE